MKPSLHCDIDGQDTLVVFRNVSCRKEYQNYFLGLIISRTIVATHHVSRRAGMDLHDHGTSCEKSESHPPRKEKYFITVLKVAQATLLAGQEHSDMHVYNKGFVSGIV